MPLAIKHSSSIKNVQQIGGNCKFDRGYNDLMQSYFMHLDRNFKQAVFLLGMLNVFFMNISFDVIVNTLTEIFNTDH